MNGTYDMGGAQGFGPIEVAPEHEEAGLGHFHEEWEKRVLGMAALLVPTGVAPIEQLRYARERQFPEKYLERTYYETWLYGLVLNLIEGGIVTPEEMIAMELITQEELDMALQMRETALSQPIPLNADMGAEPRFKVGDPVRTIIQRPSGHTREPRYARGRIGVIEYVYTGDDSGVEAARTYADIRGTTGEDVKRHLYTVRFKASELWGVHGDANSYVNLNMWEDYLEAAS